MEILAPVRNFLYLKVYLPILWSRNPEVTPSKKSDFVSIFLKLFPSPRSHDLKMKTIQRLGGKSAWVETGTYVGDGAVAISSFAEILHTIEPSRELSAIAKSKLVSRKNVELHVGTSENKLPEVLESLISKGYDDISIWLDGHYSGGQTFLGDFETPIMSELNTISKYSNSFTHLRIFIDDVRCFNPEIVEYRAYPKIRYLLDFAASQNFKISFTRDICVMKKKV